MSMKIYIDIEPIVEGDWDDPELIDEVVRYFFIENNSGFAIMFSRAGSETVGWELIDRFNEWRIDQEVSVDDLEMPKNVIIEVIFEYGK